MSILIVNDLCIVEKRERSYLVLRIQCYEKRALCELVHTHYYMFATHGMPLNNNHWVFPFAKSELQRIKRKWLRFECWRETTPFSTMCAMMSMRVTPKTSHIIHKSFKQIWVSLVRKLKFSCWLVLLLKCKLLLLAYNSAISNILRAKKLKIYQHS